MTADPPPRILPCGDSAVTVEFGDTVDAALNDRVLALDAALAGAPSAINAAAASSSARSSLGVGSADEGPATASPTSRATAAATARRTATGAARRHRPPRGAGAK